MAKDKQLTCEEKYEILLDTLKYIIKKQTTLDILMYIEKLSNNDVISATKISNDLGYDKDTVREVLKEIRSRYNAKRK